MNLFCWKRGLGVLSLALGLAGVNASRATAQTGFEIGPTVGYYLTLGSSGANDGPNTPGNFSAPIYGGELTIWTRGKLGFQAQSAIAWSSRQEITNPGGFTPQQDGHITIGSVAVIYGFDINHPRSLWISAGPGFVGYRGPAFESSGMPTEAAAVLGIGGSRSIGSSFGVTWGASTLLYQYTGIFGDIGGPPNFDGTNVTTRSGAIGHRFRTDVLLHISITLNGPS